MMEPSKILVSGYSRIINIFFSNEIYGKHERDFVSRPTELQSFDLCTSTCCFSHIFKVNGRTLVIYGSDNPKFKYPVEVNFPFELLDVQSNNSKIFIVSNGACYLWKSVDKLIKQPDVPFQSIHLDPLVAENKIKRFFYGDFHALFLTQRGNLFSVDKCSYNCKEIVNCNKWLVKDVKCSKEHALILTADGVLLSFGLGSRGQLGHGDLNEVNDPKIIEALHGIRIIRIACGGWHSAALSEFGDIYMWGWNESGQLGCVQNSASGDKTLHEESTVLFKAVPSLIEIEQVENFVEVACGSRHTVALADDGSVWSWGWNQYGQLGTGDQKTYKQPTKVIVSATQKVSNIYCCDWMTFYELSGQTS